MTNPEAKIGHEAFVPLFDGDNTGQMPYAQFVGRLEGCSLSANQIENFAIGAARGNNGGTWAEHYTPDQKHYWRNYVIELAGAIKRAQPSNADVDAHKGTLRGVIHEMEHIVIETQVARRWPRVFALADNLHTVLKNKLDRL